MMVAEGGTEYGHMVTYARSKDPYGPFESYPGNPVLTNRNLGGNENRIQGIGHGDLVQDEEGNTFMVCLGFRQNGEVFIGVKTAGLKPEKMEPYIRKWIFRALKQCRNGMAFMMFPWTHLVKEIQDGVI